MTQLNPKREPVETIALIPARGGSESIPHKNLLKLGNKSLVAWAIEAAFGAKMVDAVIVSTEDAKIAEEARKYGAIVAPRPAEYATSQSGDAGFFHHCAVWIEEEYGWMPELIVNLYPTSPMRFSEDIDAMITYINESGADGVKSVIPTVDHPYKMWKFSNKKPSVGEAGEMQPFLDTEYRRQYGPDQPRQRVHQMYPVFFQDGQINITRRKFVLRPESLEYDNIWGDNIHGFVLDPRTATDIDCEEDLWHAEKVYKRIAEERGLELE
jgi:N-acylneuraminate cytidylyltransferase